MTVDWWNVLTHSLWIVGLAVVLGLVGYADWRAAAGGRGLHQALADLVVDPLLHGGLALSCLGAGLGVAALWERLAWFLLAAVFAVRGGWLVLHTREDSPG